MFAREHWVRVPEPADAAVAARNPYDHCVYVDELPRVFQLVDGPAARVCYANAEPVTGFMVLFSPLT